MAKTIKRSKPAKPVAKTGKNLTELIRKKAYELWDKNGRKGGNAMKDWLDAERIIKQKAI